MNDSTFQALDWDAVEEFLAAFERQSFQELPREKFFESLTQGLTACTSLTDLKATIRWPNHVELFGTFGSPVINPEFVIATTSSLSAGQTQSMARQSADQGPAISVQHCLETDVLIDLYSQFSKCPPGTVQRLRELLETLALIVGNYCLRQSVRKLQSEENLRRRVDQMIRDLAVCENKPEGPHDYCQIVQQILGVDRVSLVRVRDGQAQTLGTSATASFAAHTRPVTLLEKVIAHAHQLGQSIDMTIGHAAVPSEMENDRLHRYLDESDVRLLRVVPFEEEPSSFPAQTDLVLEHFSADWPDPQQQTLYELAAPHLKDSARRLVAAREETWTGWIRSWMASRHRRWQIAGGILLVVILALMLIPYDLQISVEGTLMPVRSQGIFAPSDAVVERIDVTHGEQVSVGQTLVVLRDPELEIEERRLMGEMETLSVRLDGLKAARIRNRDVDNRSTRDTELSAQESDLQAQLAGVRAQLALVQEQKELLTITSPLDGQLNRWDLLQAFGDRPVVHGQFLFDVLDTQGDWQLELEIPDDDVGYVLASQQKAPCRVSYLYRTHPQKRYETKIESISDTTQFGENKQPVVSARAPAATADRKLYRAGASVLARIDCGRHSAGFVLFREVIEFLQRQLWF